MDGSEKRNLLVSIGFMVLFFSTITLIYFRIINTPIDQHALEYKIYPNLNKSFTEILFSNWHSETAHWRMPITNWFYHWWGVNEFTYKLFPLLVNFCTLLLIYQWTKTRIGQTEAVIAAFLFGISYYNIWITVWVHFAEFYMFASFLTILFLTRGWEKDKWINWWMFALCNFLNITNTILPFLFQPAICFVTAFLVWITTYKKPYPRKTLKLKTIQFLTTYSASLIAAIVFYQIKGVNFIKNTFDLFTKGEFVDEALLPIATKVYSFNAGTPLDNLTTLIKKTFVTLNFENHGWIMGHPFAHWLYFILFLVGLSRLYKTRKTLFGILISMFVPPVLILGLFIGMVHGRFLVFVLPFYLICVATGFVCLISTVGKINVDTSIQKTFVYIFTFFLFSWVLGFPKPVWSKKFLDESFQTEGYPAVRDYLQKNIKPNDIILNVTQAAELRGEVADALTLISLPKYFRQFYEKHRMELLAQRTGNVGIWLILEKPFSNPDFDPFYFPNGYRPKLVLQKTKTYLYRGNLNILDISNINDIKTDQVFTTPFWSFWRALTFQKLGKYKLATFYYGLFIKYGMNIERAHYNLGLMLLNFSFKLAMDEFWKAIKIMETPTQIPKDTKVNSIRVNEHDETGMAQKVSQFQKNPIRYYYQNKNGQRLKFWFKEDLLQASGHVYSQFYFLPGLALNNHYARKKEGNLKQENLKQMKLLIDKGYRIDNYSHLANEVFYHVKKFGLGKKVYPAYSYINLLGVFDPFPAIKKNR